MAEPRKADAKKAERKQQAKTDAEGRLVVATNRRARFEYEILDTYEAGIQLVGPEVKSLRAGRANLGDAFAQVHRGELWLEKLHISPYEPATRENPSDPQRRRKLLLHRRQIDALVGAVDRKGYALVPLAVYWKDGRAKLEIGLAKGKKQHDKRADEKDRDWKREKARLLKPR